MLIHMLPNLVIWGTNFQRYLMLAEKAAYGDMPEHERGNHPELRQVH
jgi:hypothetical protein